MSAYNSDTVEFFFFLAAQKSLMGNNTGVFPHFFLATLTCWVSISAPCSFASQALQWPGNFFLAWPLLIQDQSA